jgi:uncharacterized protein YjeT (DUF2065 family)
MDNTGEIVLTALALILVIEGVIYALFPDGMKKVMAAMQEIPASTLRSFGLSAAALSPICDHNLLSICPILSIADQRH